MLSIGRPDVDGYRRHFVFGGIEFVCRQGKKTETSFESNLLGTFAEA